MNETINFMKDLQQLIKTEEGKRCVMFYEKGYITFTECLELLKKARTELFIQALKNAQ